MDTKPKLIFGLALVLSAGLFGCLAAAGGQTNSLSWATFTDANRHFHFQYPATWGINNEIVSVMHYRDVFVSLNSSGRSTVDDLQVTTNTWEYGPAETIKQLPAGTVYMDIGWWEGPGPLPRFGPGIHEMEAADLSAVLKQSQEETKLDKQLVTRTIEFSKWGRRWSIVVYMHAPVGEDRRQLMEQVLESFRFDGVPAGDEIWAIGEARKKLPPEADPDQFTREGGSSVYYNQTKKDGSSVIVAFTKQFGDQSKKTWCFRVTETGTVLPMAPGENPFKER
jgi:hypothetical protein